MEKTFTLKDIINTAEKVVKNRNLLRDMYETRGYDKEARVADKSYEIGIKHLLEMLTEEVEYEETK